MAHLIRLPAMGQTMEEGTILRWMKNEGDRVEKQEPLAEIMTDKVNMEMEAPEAGVVLKWLQPVDATVPVQTPICIIGEPGEDIASLLAEAGGTAAVPAAPPDAVHAPGSISAGISPSLLQGIPADPGSGPTLSSPRARKTAGESGVDIDQLAGKGAGPHGIIQERDVLAYLDSDAAARITPLAKRMLQDVDIPSRELLGSGPGGKIRSEDVKRAMKPGEPLPAAPPAPAPAPQRPAPAGRESIRVPLTPMRKIIAENIAKSARTAPHVNMTMEADVTELVALRTRLVPDVEKRHGVRLTYTDLIVKATVTTLLHHPWLNSAYGDDGVLLHGAIHMGVATAVPDGLLVPVVRDADLLTIPEISKAIKDLAGRAREGRLKPDELSGGTFTITNLGGYGVDSFAPILNPPQAGILGVGRIVERPAFGPDRSVEARSFMNLCLSFDHRVVDGVPAAEFLRDLRDLLESPYGILV